MQPLPMNKSRFPRWYGCGDVCYIVVGNVLALYTTAHIATALVIERKITRGLEQESLYVLDRAILYGLTRPNIGFLRHIFGSLRIPDDPHDTPDEGFAITQENIGKAGAQFAPLGYSLNTKRPKHLLTRSSAHNQNADANTVDFVRLVSRIN
ncbi:MAG: hypothetical protein GAK38_04494 [Xylophilus sp.]|nr:MAG: hypothetical protein GAK38_04494 [Xylophilus sp.]